MPVAQRVRLAGRVEPFERVLADRLEHHEPLALAPHQALVHQRAERVQVGVAHRLRGLEREPAREHAEPREQRALVLLQQVVGPRERLRRASGAAPARRDARPSAASDARPAARASPRARAARSARPRARARAAGRRAARRSRRAPARSRRSPRSPGATALARSMNSATASYCDSAESSGKWVRIRQPERRDRVDTLGGHVQRLATGHQELDARASRRAPARAGARRRAPARGCR